MSYLAVPEQVELAMYGMRVHIWTTAVLADSTVLCGTKALGHTGAPLSRWRESPEAHPNGLGWCVACTAVARGP